MDPRTMLAVASVLLATTLSFQDKPQEPKPERKPDAEKQKDPQADGRGDAAEATKAASKLMYADSYRFRAEVVRTPNEEALARNHGEGDGKKGEGEGKKDDKGGQGEKGGKDEGRVAHASDRPSAPKRLEIEGRYRAGKPLMLSVPAVGLVAYRVDDAIVFKGDKEDSWASVPLDARLFGGEGKGRIKAGEGGKGEGGKAGAPGGVKGSSPRDRRPEEVDPDTDAADLQALAYLGVIPAPHALLRAIVEGGLTQATRRVERGATGSEEVVYDCRLSPAAEQLCRDHFARLLTPRGYEKVPPLDADVKVIAAAEGKDAADSVKRVVLDLRPGKDAKHAAIGLRIAYDIEDTGKADVEVPADAKGRLGGE